MISNSWEDHFVIFLKVVLVDDAAVVEKERLVILGAQMEGMRLVCNGFIEVRCLCHYLKPYDSSTIVF